MARCRPVFPALDSSSAPPPTLPSSFSASTQPRQQYNLIQRAATAHAALDAIPDELSPPSRSPSPELQSRVALLRDKVTQAVAAAGSPANPTWVQVSRMLRMACTSRLYRGVPQGVRVGENVKVDAGNFKWVLPDTAEEWERCEEEWKRRFLNSSKGEGQSSKYWPPKPTEPQQPEEVNRTPSKAELVRDKVRAWQATLAPTVEEEITTTVETIDDISQRKPDVVLKETIARTKQSPIPFPVSKPSAVAAGKKLEKNRESSTSPVDAEQLPLPEARVQSAAAKSAPSSNPDPLHIVDVSEMSFLPPSFPTQLETSTPPLPNKAKVTKPRAKPAPILPLRPAESSPSSSPRLPNSALDRIVPPIASSSSLPSTPKRPVKHPRPLTPPADASSAPTTDERPAKKLRAGPEDSPIGQSSAQPPPSTPLLATSPRTPSPLLRRGLGNAKGVIMPSTPTNNALPTLTELLASTRRSRPRPRPPSRKIKPTATEDAEQPGARDAQAAREPSPAATAISRAKTVFSSPASGSSDSPQSLRDRPRSPISPLFSNTFAPPFASTQQGGPGAGGFGGMAASSQAHGVGLARGGSGMVGMGYNSQFDLEGQIGEVSDLLERDVDFDGWLRDIPEVDAEG